MFLKDNGNPKVVSEPTFNENGLSPRCSGDVSRVLYENSLVPVKVVPGYTTSLP